MTSRQPLAAVGSAFLLVLFSACVADSTGPDEPEFVSDRLVFNIGQIEVIHDCDPAWDNPGDFQGFVEIWKVNPTTEELLAASPRRTLLLHSGESAFGDHIRAESLIARDPAHPVRLRGYFRELDHGVVDAGTELDQTIRWNEHRQCWQLAGGCLLSAGADAYYKTWTHHVHTRDNVWNPFSSDDEGCKFNVTFVANISES